MPYIPTPMVNFNYEPAKSDARRILDTQKEIKQEQQKDQEFEQKMLLSQQAYEMGKMQMQKAQIEADQLIKQKRLDEGAGQVYNSVIASGGTKGDGYKAVQDYYLREGGWAAGQKAKEEAAAAWKEAWEMADVNPAAAEEAAEIANSMAPPGSPRMTAQSIMEAKKRLKAENQKPIVGEDGDVLFMQPDGTWKVENMLSDTTKKMRDEENRLKQAQIDAQLRGQTLSYAGQKLAADSRAELGFARLDNAILLQELRRLQQGEGISQRGEEARKTKNLDFENKKALLPLELQNDLEKIQAKGEITLAVTDAVRQGQMDRELVKGALREKLQEKDISFRTKALELTEAGKNTRSAEMATIRREANLLTKARDAARERQVDIQLKIAEKLATGKLEDMEEVRKLKQQQQDIDKQMKDMELSIDMYKAQSVKVLGEANLQQRKTEFDTKNQQGYFNRPTASETAKVGSGKDTKAYKVAAADFTLLDNIRKELMTKDPNRINALLQALGVQPTNNPAANQDRASQELKKLTSEKVALAQSLRQYMTEEEVAIVDEQAKKLLAETGAMPAGIASLSFMKD